MRWMPGSINGAQRMNDRLIDWLLRRLDALELAFDRNDEREFDEITRQIRDILGRALLNG